MVSNKVFDDYHDLKQVDCEECENIYTGACDGIPQGSTKPCTSFLATRRVVTLRELESLTERLERLRKGCIATDIIIILHLLGHIFFG